MPFLLRDEAREWFRYVKDDFDLNFDMYYLCLLPGLSQGEKQTLPGDKTSELVDNFPGSYQSRGPHHREPLLEPGAKRVGRGL